MNIKKHIPNTITCGNLLCGCIAIVFALKGKLVWSAYLVGIAAVLDFLDGFTARLLKVHSEIGKQLDSMADMVTFGVVPGVMMFQLMGLSSMSLIMHSTTAGVSSMDYFLVDIPFFAYLLTIFSAIRLAKFNIDTRQTSSFIGVPTPASAVLICSLILINKFQPFYLHGEINKIINNFYFLFSLTIVLSYLMVAELPLFALKFKNFSWADNKIRYVFLIIALFLLILLQYIAIPIIIFLYIILSIINNFKNRNEIQSRN